MSKSTYLVTLNQETSPEDIESIKEHFRKQDATIKHDYPLIKGFSFSIPNSVEIASHENVKTMEKDTEVHTQDQRETRI